MADGECTAPDPLGGGEPDLSAAARPGDLSRIPRAALPAQVHRWRRSRAQPAGNVASRPSRAARPRRRQAAGERGSARAEIDAGRGAAPDAGEGDLALAKKEYRIIPCFPNCRRAITSKLLDWDVGGTTGKIQTHSPVPCESPQK